MNPRLPSSYVSDYRLAKVGPVARDAHFRAFLWLASNESRTFGVLPLEIASQYADESTVAALVAEGLWEPIAQGEARTVEARTGNRSAVTFPAEFDGYYIRDYLVANATGDEYQAHIKRQQAAGRKSAAKRRIEADG